MKKNGLLSMEHLIGLAWDNSHQALIGHNLNGFQVINNYLNNVSITL
jgi:hypothetical protein